MPCFPIKIENIGDSSSEIEEGVTSNDDIHEEDKEEGEISDSNTGKDFLLKMILCNTFNNIYFLRRIINIFPWI